MKKIALISDTHNYLDPSIFKHLEQVDEIWHAGDVGTIDIIERLKKIKTLRAVYGNIDGQDVRKECPLIQRFFCEQVDVLITHIGGYPGRYNPDIKLLLEKNTPDLFICGHSHILKVINDKQLNLLHMNPGACGIHGFHQIKTLLLFNIEGKKIKDLRVVELGPSR
ncbi:MAG: metallophosphoesterase family protein [Bacteroidetes bacterium]|nr:metallophosphoesterase family protein [Bacteroidota bacterium]HET6243667.1 metallophosphoesterase family protein [Bacteroidia bacterium]